MDGFGSGKSETYQLLPLFEPILRWNFLIFDENFWKNQVLEKHPRIVKNLLF